MEVKCLSQKQLVSIKDLGKIEYEQAHHIQQQAVKRVIIEGHPTILLCEHNPVFTLGRLGSENNFLLAQTKIKELGAKILRIDRGGEVTFHGPGQIIMYPILDLNKYGKDLRRYLEGLEQVTIELLQYFGIVASRLPGQRGVWVNDKKIASIGIGVRKWVSYHGMAINVATNLNYFAMIKPCGLDATMTSMNKELGRVVDFNEVKQKLIEYFCHHFGLEIGNKTNES